MDAYNKYLDNLEQEDEEDFLRMQATTTNAIALFAQHNSRETTENRGSCPGRAPNVERQRQATGHNLMEDYFVERPIYDNATFHRRYRMQISLFNRIMLDLCNNDIFWRQKRDCTGMLGLLPQRKMTDALRMLAYGAGADQCDEISRMGTSTALKCFKKFVAQIELLYGGWYLRPPNAADLRRLLTRAECRKFSGMIGSIDGMHWKWKNCPKGWAGAFSGRKGYPTVILEVVASYDTHIWHAFFGTPGAQNDLNVLGASDVFSRVIQGSAPEVVFKVNGITYTNGYYLADGIYPTWSTFVKSIRKPQSAEEQHFCKMQESYRKDVERCFGILQARWAILRHGCNLFKLEDLRTIMISCIILHNMIVEDEFVEEDFVETDEEDNMNPQSAWVYTRPVDAQGNVIPPEPIQRDGRVLPQFIDRSFQIQNAYLHKALQNDLVIHMSN